LTRRKRKSTTAAERKEGGGVPLLWRKGMTEFVIKESESPEKKGSQALSARLPQKKKKGGKQPPGGGHAGRPSLRNGLAVEL